MNAYIYKQYIYIYAKDSLTGMICLSVVKITNALIIITHQMMWCSHILISSLNILNKFME